MGFHRKHTCIFCTKIMIVFGCSSFAGIHQLVRASGACVFLRFCRGCSFFLGMSCCMFGASTSFVQRSSSQASGVLFLCLHTDNDKTKKKVAHLNFQYVWAQEKVFRYHFDKTQSVKLRSFWNFFVFFRRKHDEKHKFKHCGPMFCFFVIRKIENPITKLQNFPEIDGTVRKRCHLGRAQPWQSPLN